MCFRVEWQWARAQGPGLTAENCGIVGGCDVAFLRHFAETALALVERPENAPGWMRHPDKWRFVYIVEQFMLSACLGYHRFNPTSPHKGVRVEYLFRSWDEARNPNQAARLGFTHLMAYSKRAPESDAPFVRARAPGLAGLLQAMRALSGPAAFERRRHRNAGSSPITRCSGSDSIARNSTIAAGSARAAPTRQTHSLSSIAIDAPVLQRKLIAGAVADPLERGATMWPAG